MNVCHEYAMKLNVKKTTTKKNNNKVKKKDNK